MVRSIGAAPTRASRRGAPPRTHGLPVRPCTRGAWRPSPPAGRRMSSRAVMRSESGSTTSHAGRHGETCRANSDSDVQMVPSPAWTRWSSSTAAIGSRLVARRAHTDSRVPLGRQQHPDPWRAALLRRVTDQPAPVHPQVGVQRPAVVEPRQQVLAVRARPKDGPSGQIDAGKGFGQRSSARTRTRPRSATSMALAVSRMLSPSGISAASAVRPG